MKAVVQLGRNKRRTEDGCGFSAKEAAEAPVKAVSVVGQAGKPGARGSKVKPLKKFCCLKRKKRQKSDGEWVVRREAESRQGLGYAMD